MTAMVDHAVLGEAQRFIYLQDTKRDRTRVQQLTARGWTGEQIAREVGCSERQVERLRAAPALPEPPRCPPPDAISADRADDLEMLAVFAGELAQRLRDEDPAIVALTLRCMPKGRLAELAIVALAAMPIDRPRSEIFSWVMDLPAAREES